MEICTWALLFDLRVSCLNLGMFCQLVFGWWFCTPICKSTRTYSHDVNFFFLWRRKWCVFSLMVFFVTRRHKILRRSTLEREPHDYNLFVRIKWECILILKTSRILSYLGLKPSFLNLKYNGVVSMPESTTLPHEINNLITHEINSYFLQN